MPGNEGGVLGEGLLENGGCEEVIGWEEGGGKLFLVQGASEMFNFLNVLEMGRGGEFFGLDLLKAFFFFFFSFFSWLFSAFRWQVLEEVGALKIGMVGVWGGLGVVQLYMSSDGWKHWLLLFFVKLGGVLIGPVIFVMVDP